MAEDPPTRSRAQTIPVREWWPKAVKRQMSARRINQEELAALIKVGTSELSRALSLKIPAIPILVAVSEELGIAFPFLIPDSEEEAIHLAQQRRFYKRDAEIAEIVTGVGVNPRESQSAVIESEHAIRQGKRRPQRTKARPSAR